MIVRNKIICLVVISIISLSKSVECLQCYTCSSDSLGGCATLKLKGTDELPVKECPGNVTDCHVYVASGVTRRGCGIAPNNNTDVFSCSSSKCNGNIFPEDRLHCLHCAGRPCVNASSHVDVRYPCVNYAEGDSCYSVFSQDGQLAYRGCNSDDPLEPGVEFCTKHSRQCLKCPARGCNDNHPEIERKLSCYKCDGKDCILASNTTTPVLCDPFVTDYKNYCFTRVANGSVSRGCILEHSELQADCDSWFSTTCEECDGKDCNQYPIVSETCVECDAKTDANCTNNPGENSKKLCPLHLKPLGCYRISEDGQDQNLRRGCLNELSEDEYTTCQISSNTTCHSCFGDGCNIKAQPQSCHICNSTTDKNCVQSPHLTQKHRCYNYYEECFTAIRGTEVFRGCSKTDFVHEELCGGGNSQNCQTCEGDDCNKSPLQQNTCYQCDSATDPNCATNLNETMAVQCPLSVQSSCYHSISETGVQRGCSSHLTGDQFSRCEKGDTTCKTCTGNKCNVNKSFPKCRVCSSKDSVNCIRGPGGVASKTCRSYSDECFVHVAGDIVTRGCLQEQSEGPTNYENECKSGDVCEKCSNGDNCNNKIVDGEFCIECDSQTDIRCRLNAHFGMRKQCPLAVKHIGCYRFEDNKGDLVKRGCLSNVTTNEVNMCRREGPSCKTCIGNDCNAKAGFQTCRICSSKDSVNCIRGPGGVITKTCKHYLDECFVHVAGDIVTRGCLQEQPTSGPIDFVGDCKNGDICEKCSNGTNCNNKIVDGEFCLTCDSQTDQKCKSNVSNVMRRQCPLAVKPLGCYRFEDNRGDLVKRGCLSNVTQNEINMCRDEGPSCKTCIGNDCNAKLNYQTCRVCSSKDTVNCIRGPGGVKTKTCKHYLDECFVHVAEDVVTRGCLKEESDSGSFDYESDCKNDNICLKCSNKQNCNNKVVDGEFCLTCDSEHDPNCHSNVTIAMRKQCPLAVKTLGCYRLEDNGGDLVKRGCLSNVTQFEMDMCRKEDLNCKTCTGNDCNSKLTFQKCRICSSKDSVSCIRGPGGAPTKTCKNYLDECFVHVEGDVVTRGCLQEKSLAGPTDFANECKNGDVCEKCSNGENCNNKIVDGEFCLTCDSQTNVGCKRHVSIGMRTQCPLAVKPVGCYRFEDNNGDLVKRGCLSNVTHYERDMCRRQGPNCKFCIGNDCNSKVNFQKCRECSSKDSVNCIRGPGGVKTKTCKDYDDECFLHVAGDVVTRGCVQEKTIEGPVDYQTECKNDDACIKCSNAENCNNKIVDGEFCLACDSQNDPNCRSNVSIAMRQQCPLAVNHLGCYRFEDNGGDLVKRGCLSNVTAFEIDMCRKEGENCKYCYGNDCNNQISFQKCRTCSSNNTVDCVRWPHLVQSKTCKSYKDECFLHVAGDVVTRGCLKEQPFSFTTECYLEDVCEKCSDENCNKKVVDGEFCLTCDSDIDPKCRTNVSFAMRTQCPLAVKPLGCYRFEDNGGELVKRGCLSNVTHYEVNMCRQEGSTCKTCLGNDCNNKLKFEQCLICNSEDDPNCLAEPELVGNMTCFNYLDSCFTHFENNVVQRGCLSTSNTAVVSDCKKGSPKCTLCHGEIGGICNKDALGDERCYVCDSRTDPNCATSPNVTVSTVCGTTRNAAQGCYLDIANNTVIRGCISNLESSDQDACLKNPDSCKTCLGHNCNKKIGFQSCYKCNSSQSNDCTIGENTLPVHVCREYVDSCVTTIDIVGRTYRGCSKEINETVIQTENTTCSENVCNAGIFPPDRLYCQQCSGSFGCNSVHLEDVKLGICQIYAKNDSCYTHISKNFFDDLDNRKEVRGCASDHDQNKRECDADPERCVKCQGNGCNNQTAVTVPTLSCIRCADTDSCKWGHNATIAEKCRGAVIFPEKESCFTTWSEENEPVRRGCTLDTEVVCTKNRSCDLCPFNACNRDNKIKQWCFQCRSSFDGRCRGNSTDVDPIVGDYCAGPPFSIEDRGCFTKEYKDGSIARGCIKDLPTIERQECENKTDTTCSLCLNNFCNDDDRSTSGASSWSIQALPIFTFILMLLFTRFIS